MRGLAADVTTTGARIRKFKSLGAIDARCECYICVDVHKTQHLPIMKERFREALREGVGPNSSHSALKGREAMGVTELSAAPMRVSAELWGLGVKWCQNRCV